MPTLTAAWLYLLTAGLFEIGWPLGLKLSQQPGRLLGGLTLALGALAASGTLLWLAQRHIPLGTAYAVWTGIGAAGTFIVGVTFFQDALSLTRGAGVLLIVGGVVALKFG